MATNNELNVTLSGQTGTGQFAGSISPSFTTPSLGAATASSVNGNVITTSTGTLTIAAGKTILAANNVTFSDTVNFASTFTTAGPFAISGAFSTTFTMTNNTSVTFPTSGTLATTSQLTSGTVTSIATSGLATGGTITSSGTITVTAATSSDQHTGTSTSVAVVPNVQQNHDSAMKAWFQATVSGGVVTVNSSYNVSSVVRNTTGDFTVNFTSSFSAANYGFMGCIDNGGAANFVIKKSGGTYSVSAFEFLTEAITGVLGDPSFMSIAFFGRA